MTIVARAITITLFSLAAAAAGCMGDPAEEGTPEPDGDVETITGALTFSPAQSGSSAQRGYVWTSGSPGTPMVPSSGNSCFISGVFGSFTSTNDQVYISNQIVNGVATWVLTGTRGSGSPGGRAFCFLGRPALVAGLWSQGQAEIDLGSTSDRTCYLTRVKGRFDLSPYDASVRIVRRTARWRLGGAPAGTGYGLQAGATCIAGAPFFTTIKTISATGTREMVRWGGGTGSTPFGAALMSVSGYLGGGSRVELMVVKYSDGERQWLLTEQQNGTLPLSGSALDTM